MPHRKTTIQAYGQVRDLYLLARGLQDAEERRALVSKAARIEALILEGELDGADICRERARLGSYSSPARPAPGVGTADGLH